MFEEEAVEVHILIRSCFTKEPVFTFTLVKSLNWDFSEQMSDLIRDQNNLYNNDNNPIPVYSFTALTQQSKVFFSKHFTGSALTWRIKQIQI